MSSYGIDRVFYILVRRRWAKRLEKDKAQKRRLFFGERILALMRCNSLPF